MILYLIFFGLLILTILMAILFPFLEYKNYIKTKMPYKKSLQKLKQEKNFGIMSLFLTLGTLILLICTSMNLFIIILLILTLLRPIVSYILIKKYIKEYILEEEKPEAKEEKSEHRI